MRQKAGPWRFQKIAGDDMKFTILLSSEDDSTTPLMELQIERTAPLQAATLGLTLEESKHILVEMQKELVETEQVEPSKAEAGPVTAVGLDSGCVKDCRPHTEGSFEVVVGRILNKNTDSRSRGFERMIDSNDVAAHRLRQRLSEQGQIPEKVNVFMESAVNQLIDKRMSKSQQMRWSPMGAHALLQVRAEEVLRIL